MDRLDVSTVAGGLKAALALNVPLYLPPGQYDAPKLTADTLIDIEGDGPDSKLRVAGEPWTAGKGVIKLAKLGLVGMTAGGMHNLVDCDAAQVDPPHISFDRVISNGVGLVNWGEYADRGISITQLEATRCEIRNALRPFMVNGGAARKVYIDGLLIDGCKRFGFMVSASSRSGQLRCTGGVIRNVQVLNGQCEQKINNNAFFCAGRFFEMSGITIANWNPKRPTDGTTNDNEPFYSKCDHLVAEGIVIVTVGGGQALLAAKGLNTKSGAESLGGTDYTFRNCYLEAIGGAYGAIWLQANGRNQFINVATKNCGMQMRTHESILADVVMDNWRAWDVPATCPRMNLLAGHGTLAIKNSTFPPDIWLFDSHYPADLVVKIYNTPGVKLRPNEQDWVVDAPPAAAEAEAGPSGEDETEHDRNDALGEREPPDDPAS